MSKAEEIKAQFEERLKMQKRVRESCLEADLKVLRASLLREFRASLPPDLGQRATDMASRWQAPAALSLPVQPLMNISTSTELQELDDTFIRSFDLGVYYPTDRLDYPTVYCETLEEFYTPIVEQMDISPEARRQESQRLISTAEEQARQRGGGMFGYNLPGKGAYLNGWLFALGQDFSPLEAIHRPEILRSILGTAAHEKLGHGFLNIYSALGEVKNRLGLTQMDLARRFGLRAADEPTASLRREQATLLFRASQLLEEGWATWVETWLAASLLGSGLHPRSNLQKVIDAINGLPLNLPQRQEIQQSLLGAILILFGEENAPLKMLHQAVLVLEVIGTQVDELLGPKLGQPLRYLIGELLCYQAEVNMGALCVPYAALIAAGVTFDPAQVSLSDLRDLLQRDPRLNPDVRLAALSRMKLDRKDDVHAMARQAESMLSFSIPQELK